MGAGIAAVVPIILGPPRSGWVRNVDADDFAPDFFECYDVSKDGRVYTIKHEILLNNYKSFLTEFYDLIGEERNISEISQVDSYGKFGEAFDRDARNASVPFIDCTGFSMLGGNCKEYWMFYSGSYKAFLEEYSTLTHFERILANTMKNPLASAIKFGIYG